MAEKSIGALWAKQGKNGTYYTGNIELNGEKIGVVAFYNGNKKNPKEPDYRILIAQKQEPEQKDNPLPTYPEEVINPDDIPF